MRFKINPVLDIETLRWVSDDGTIEYSGPIISFGGPSAEAKANEAAQTAFYKQMSQQQSEVFAESQAVLGEIKAVEEPIFKAGPDQYGYSPGEDAALRTGIVDRGAQAEKNAVDATQLREMQLTGGAKVLPTGATAELEENARVLSEQSTASQLNNEKLTGYAVGREKFGQSLAALTGQQQLMNPVGYSEGTSRAGESATGAINLADSERSTLVSSLLGGLAQGAVKGFTTAATGGAMGFGG